MKVSPIYLTSSPLVDIWVVSWSFLFYICPFLSSSTDSYIEVLDGSRVHPETYEWARKMAVDALEYDESAEDANPAGALEEILENPERLKDLDLDAFAEELERQVSDCKAGQEISAPGSWLGDLGSKCPCSAGFCREDFSVFVIFT